MTFEVEGSDDSKVVLLLVLMVGELVLVSELEPLPVDVKLAETSEVDELRSADEVEGFAIVETPEPEVIEFKLRYVDISEEPLGIVVAVEVDRVSVDNVIKLALESDVIDWIGRDVVEG